MSRLLAPFGRLTPACLQIAAVVMLTAVPVLGADPPVPAQAYIFWSQDFGLFALSPSAAISEELKVEKGLVVCAVGRGSSAEKAGLRRGDVLVFSDVFGKVDQTGFVQILRGGEERKLNISTRAHSVNDFAWSDEEPSKEKRTLTVKSDGSGSTRTINAALLQAAPGDTVLVADGLYEEPLMPPPRVTLAADEGAEVRIVSALPLRLMSADGAVVRGLTLRSDDIAALVVRGSNLELRDCDLQSQNKMVLGLSYADDVRVLNCRIGGGGKNNGLEIDHSRIKIDRTSFSNVERGVFLSGESQCELSNSLIDGVKFGVVATASQVRARGNTLNGADDGSGFFAGGSAVLELTGNFIRRYQQGVYVLGGRCELTKNTIGQNRFGIYCADGEVIAVDNFITGNRFDGVRFALTAEPKAEKQAVTLRNNRISGHGVAGVSLDGCTAQISHNLVESNFQGIVAENVKLEAEHNTIVLQRQFGLDLKSRTTGKVDANIIAYNSIGLLVDVDAAVSHERNVVYANYVSKVLPLTDGNFARRDRIAMTGGETLHVIAYPADELKSETDSVVDPKFVRVGEDYRLSAESPLVKPGADPAQIAGAFPLRTTGAEPFFSTAGEKLLAEMKLPEAVAIDAYFSSDLPEWLTARREACTALLKQLEFRFPGRISVRFRVGDPLTDEVIEEARLKGIPLRRYPKNENDELESGKALFGLAVSAADKEAVIPILDRAVSVEYQLLHALDALSARPRKTLGLVTTEVKVLGGFDLQRMAPQPAWTLANELKKQYDVIEIDPERPIEAKVDALLVVQPSSLTPEGLTNLFAAIRTGTPTVLLEDPLPVYVATTSGTLEPRRQPAAGAGMFGGPPPRPKADLAELWKTLAVKFGADRVIWQDHNPFTAIKPWQKELVVLDEESGAKPPFAPSEASTFGLRRMVVPAPGAIEQAPETPLEFVPLLRTGAATGTVDCTELFSLDLNGGRQLNPDRKRVSTSQSHILAAQIRERRRTTEPAKDGAMSARATTPGMNVVLVGDIDFISPGFLSLVTSLEVTERGREFEVDNLNFALNVIDSLTGDVRFVPIRSRRASEIPPQAMLARASATAGGGDWRTKIRFENDRPASLGPLPNAFLTYKSWTESEQSRMLACLERLQEKWPGLLERVTAARPLRLYRQPKLIRASLKALAVPGFNAFVVADGALLSAGSGADVSELDVMTAHELVHLVDSNAVPNLTELDEWKTMVGPRIDRVAARLKALDPQLTIGRADGAEKRYSEIAWNEGMPRLYACRNLQEALACQAEWVLYPEFSAASQAGTFQVPNDVEAFLLKYVLNADVAADPTAVAYALGRTAAEERRFTDAVTAFNTVIEQCDRSAEVYRSRADVLRNLDRLEEAVADLTKAVGLGDDESYRTQGEVFAELNKSAEALEAFSAYINKHPEDERGYEARGREYIRVKQWPQAREDFQKSLALNPTNYSPIYFLGFTYFSEAKYDEAIDYFTRAIEAEAKVGASSAENSATVRSLLFRSFAWQMKRQPDKQVADLSALIALNPGQANYYVSRVKAYEQLKQYDKAADDYTRLIELQPETFDHWFNRGNAHRLSGKNAEAIADYTQFLKKNPKGIGAYYFRGEIRRSQGELDLALADYDAFLAVSPDSDSLHYTRGLVLQAKGDYDKALSDFDAAIRLNPKDSSFLLERGKTWASKGDRDKAIADFDEALRLNPKNASAYVNRGRAWGGNKDYDKAIADYDQALAISPQYAYAFYLRGYSRNQKKEFALGTADLRESIRLDPEYSASRNSLAWLLATCPEERFRNGREAVEHALKACELSQEKNSNHLGTLAAAYAEAGDFDQAVRWETKAIELNSTGFDKAGAEERMKLFQQKQPYRQPQ